MTTKHTLTPLSLERTIRRDGELGCIVIFDAAGQKLFQMCGVKNVEERATEIVHACNAHEEFVAFAEQVRRDAEHAKACGQNEVAMKLASLLAIIDTAACRAALAKAEGK